MFYRVSIRSKLLLVFALVLLPLAGITALSAYRQWQQEIRKAAGAKDSGNDRFRGLQGAEPWSHNPFSARNVDRL